MDRPSPADLQLPEPRAARIPDAAEPELLVELRLARWDHAGDHDRHRHRAGDALHAQHHDGLRQRRARHARRQLWLADPLPAHERRDDVLHRHLHPHLPRAVFRILQDAARAAVDARRHHPAADDGKRLHGLWAALGPDELLGRHRHHQPVLGDPFRHRRLDRDLAVGRLLGRQPAAEPLLLAALPAALRDRRGGHAAPGGAAPLRLEQPARHRRQGAAGQDSLPPLLHGEGRLRPGGAVPGLCRLPVLRAELLRRAGQLHPGQSAGDAAAHRAGMVLPALLRHPALDPEQAARRHRDVQLDPGAVHPALARPLAGAQRELPPDLQVAVLGVPLRLRGARLGRRAPAGRRVPRRSFGGDRPHLHLLLLLPLPHPGARARDLRAAATAAAEHQQACAARRRLARRRPRQADGENLMRLRSLALAATLAALAAGPAAAAEEAALPHLPWSFDGLFGTYDQASLKRGFEVYRQVCSTCHAMHLLAYRDLEAIGYTADQVKEIAASFQTTDGPNDAGEMYQRPARASDRFHSPFANDAAARAANNGALPADQSLIAKARVGGTDYIYALLTRYGEPPADLKMQEGMKYNKNFPGHKNAM